VNQCPAGGESDASVLGRTPGGSPEKRWTLRDAGSCKGADISGFSMNWKARGIPCLRYWNQDTGVYISIAEAGGRQRVPAVLSPLAGLQTGSRHACIPPERGSTQPHPATSFGDLSMTCPTCDGDGEIKCRTCEGVGTFYPLPATGLLAHECGKCDGKGTIECPRCHGSGEVDEDDE